MRKGGYSDSVICLSAGEAEQRMDLTDEQWEVLEPLIPAPPQREDGRERPWRDPRDVLNGILWILRTGAPCKDLPERYPPYQSCHRRFQKWIEEGVLGSVLEALAKDLEERGERDRPLGVLHIDGTFVVAKKGGVCRKDQAGQSYEAHGVFRRLFYSSRPPHIQRECFTARDHPC
jgi:transposase